MPDFALAAAGVIVFALTTWASLAFGYQVFQNMYETDNPDEAIPTRIPTGELIPVPAVVTTDDDLSLPSEFVVPASPAA